MNESAFRLSWLSYPDFGARPYWYFGVYSSDRDHWVALWDLHRIEGEEAPSLRLSLNGALWNVGLANREFLFWPHELEGELVQRRYMSPSDAAIAKAILASFREDEHGNKETVLLWRLMGDLINLGFEEVRYDED